MIFLESKQNIIRTVHICIPLRWYLERFRYEWMGSNGKFKAKKPFS
jgi:hypothetical protein